MVSTAGSCDIYLEGFSDENHHIYGRPGGDIEPKSFRINQQCDSRSSFLLPRDAESSTENLHPIPFHSWS